MLNGVADEALREPSIQHRRYYNRYPAATTSSMLQFGTSSVLPILCNVHENPEPMTLKALRISSWVEAHAMHKVGKARVASEVIKSEPPFNKW